jgi:hypothetical protein
VASNLLQERPREGHGKPGRDLQMLGEAKLQPPRHAASGHEDDLFGERVQLFSPQRVRKILSKSFQPIGSPDGESHAT